ncbi:MAG: phosphate ABC transporter permease subunit PstC [Bacteroidia bacterium]|nr:phosphate ABC transporter permease subunit PstC [Bacteroidia bacterium]
MLYSIRRYQEFFRKSWMQITLGVILLLPLAIGLSLLYKSLPLITETKLSGFLFGSEWLPGQGKFGLLPFITSSIIVSLIGLLLMVPICLTSAIYITQFAPPWISRLLRSVIDILAGIPSVIFGLWGVITIVPMVAGWALKYNAENTSGYSIIAAGVVVSVSVMPFVLNMLIGLFESVAIELKEASLSMGASYWQTIKWVIVKKIRPGIIAAFTLGVSKSFGETIAVLMVVGNVVKIPNGIFDAGYPLPALLANNYGEMMSIPMYDAALMFSALILLIIVIFFNYLAHRVIRYYQSQA